MQAGQEYKPIADVFAQYRGVRVVVLGASGFVGRWVSRLLCHCGAEISLPVRDPRTAEAIFARYDIEGDVIEADLGRDPGVLESVFRRARPAVTFNLAGYGIDRSERDEATAYSVNEALVMKLCHAAAKYRERAWSRQAVVHVGSALEYGEISNDLREDSDPCPTTLYGRSKLAGTRALVDCCDRLDVNGITARLFTVYGPGEHAGRLLPALMETARTGQALKLTDGRQKRDFTYVEDVAEGLLRLGLGCEPGGKAVNLATGSLLTVRQFVETAADVLSIPPERLQFGEIPTRVEEMSHLPVSVERLRRTTGWVPGTHVSEGIRRTAEFYSEQTEE